MYGALNELEGASFWSEGRGSRVLDVSVGVVRVFGHGHIDKRGIAGDDGRGV